MVVNGLKDLCINPEWEQGGGTWCCSPSLLSGVKGHVVFICLTFKPVAPGGALSLMSRQQCMLGAVVLTAVLSFSLQSSSPRHLPEVKLLQVFFSRLSVFCVCIIFLCFYLVFVIKVLSSIGLRVVVEINWVSAEIKTQNQNQTGAGFAAALLDFFGPEVESEQDSGLKQFYPLKSQK